MRPVCRGTFWVASRVSSTVSNFKRERGISLEMLQQERASSRMMGEPRGFSGVAAGFSSYDRELREPRDVQSSFELRGRARDCSRATAGQINLI